MAGGGGPGFFFKSAIMKIVNVTRRVAAAAALMCVASQPLFAETFSERMAPCLACHGETGDGTGPVGDAFMTRPADLRSDRVHAMSDGQLLRAMLTGPGHAPAVETVPPPVPRVLEHIVLPQHRWAIVLYVRGLGSRTFTPARK
jgi:hypothetical protein